MNFRNMVWWLGFILVAIWAQSLVPGVDFLVVGLVLSLQEGRLKQTCWLGACVLLIQEGTSTLSFGTSLLLDGIAVVAFIFGRWLFQSRNVLFLSLLGGVLGLSHYLIVPMMAYLEDYSVPRESLLLESVIQAAIFPPVWLLAHTLRSLRKPDVVPV